jgi:hypothetical protein
MRLSLTVAIVFGLGLVASAADPAAKADSTAKAPAAKPAETAKDKPAATATSATATSATATSATATSATSTGKMVDMVFIEKGDEKKPVPAGAIEVKLPQPMFEGTPKNLKPAATLEKYVDRPRPPFQVPAGCTNVALSKPVKASDMDPIIGELKCVNDGDIGGGDGSYVELGPGLQWVQIDLKEKAAMYALLVWHYHSEGRVYHDMVVQVSDDPDFIQGVKTVYNNDFDNSAGLGIGKDLEYVEDFRGRLIDAKGVTGRYLRLYSNGNTSNDQNHYIEVQVFGIPAK